MAKPTTIAEAGVSSNALEIVWPLDEAGFTSMLKKEGVRAVGRLAGNDAKMQVFMDTLRVLAQHAIAKMDVQKGMQAQAVAEQQRLEDVLAAAAFKQQEADMTRLRVNVAEAQAKIDAHEAAEAQRVADTAGEPV